MEKRLYSIKGQTENNWIIEWQDCKLWWNQEAMAPDFGEIHDLDNCVCIQVNARHELTGDVVTLNGTTCMEATHGFDEMEKDENTDIEPVILRDLGITLNQ